MARIRRKRVWMDVMRCILDWGGVKCPVFAMVVLLWQGRGKWEE